MNTKKHRIICPHTSEIPDLLGNIMKPSECVLLHVTPTFTKQSQGDDK